MSFALLFMNSNSIPWKQITTKQELRLFCLMILGLCSTVILQIWFIFLFLFEA